MADCVDQSYFVIVSIDEEWRLGEVAGVYIAF